jgi:hypothetical protein
MIIMKIERKFVLLVVIISVLGATFVSAATAGPTFGEITLSPAAPTALSTVTLSVILGGDTPSDVRVTVEECNGRTGICYPDIQNVSMSLFSAGNYKTNVTLKHADATYITCQVVAKTSGTWTSSPKKNVNLSENTNGNHNGNNGNDDKTPGFEVVLFIIAIGLSLIVLGRKRVK